MKPWLAIALICAGCKANPTSPSGQEAAATTPVAKSGSGATTAPQPCEAMPFAESTPVPEASGAAWFELDGKLALVVVADSGHDGAYAVVDPDSGATRDQGTFPLGDASDDVEGLAGRDATIYGITSSGWMRAWQRKDGAFALIDGPYPVGNVEPGGMACKARGINCGRNYEGLCIVERAHANGPCAGFAASKEDGALYCLREASGRFTADRSLSIPITGSERIADCAFSNDGTLWVGSNLIGGALVYRIDGWSDPASAKVVEIGSLGTGFPETIAVRDDAIYRMSDTGGDWPSSMKKYRCRR
ncbi:MAG: hypothetical protein AB7L28_03945 [Kofleriaceae bacterium]